jgi:hypothetical protein
VIALPPFEEGAVQDTVALAAPAVALPIVGAPGVAIGVTDPDAADSGPHTVTPRAATVQVYAVPAVPPVTAIGLVSVFPDVIAVPPPDGVHVARYWDTV